MIPIVKGSPPRKNPKDDLEKRKKDFEDAFKLEESKGASFDSVNIKAWKTAFYTEAKERYPERRYSFRKKKNGKYEIWRLKDEQK